MSSVSEPVGWLRKDREEGGAEPVGGDGRTVPAQGRETNVVTEPAGAPCERLL